MSFILHKPFKQRQRGINLFKVEAKESNKLALTIFFYNGQTTKALSKKNKVLTDNFFLPLKFCLKTLGVVFLPKRRRQ